MTSSLRAQCVLYHDVVDGDGDASGFPGTAAARYKLPVAEFRSHLDAIAKVVIRPATTLRTTPANATAPPFIFSIDDGGSSALHIADELERLNWRGTFFVTSARVGTPAFLKSAEVRALHDRGHAIGSHSATHPYRIGDLPDADLAREWSDSMKALNDMVGSSLDSASVPGGYYRPRVASAAASSGIRHLFTSEPTAQLHMESGIAIYGRYCVYRGMSPATAAGLSAGNLMQTAHQKVVWKAKGLAKRVAAPAWEAARSIMFRKQA
ncbi:MAG: polysaccharide deacetylase family protein [Hyphomicrobiaceae bacterium]|nr:polysaccharide deacetylase family protein [Hyphomicrobiaceae bacterium]